MANTAAYTFPVSGATPPTAAQSKKKNHVIAVITGDNSATTFDVTHNWNISAADLAAGFPKFNIEPILASGITAAPWVAVAGKTANTVTFTCTAFTGAGVRVVLERPYSAAK